MCNSTKSFRGRRKSAQKVKGGLRKRKKKIEKRKKREKERICNINNASHWMQENLVCAPERYHGATVKERFASRWGSSSTNRRPLGQAVV